MSQLCAATPARAVMAGRHLTNEDVTNLKQFFGSDTGMRFIAFMRNCGRPDLGVGTVSPSLEEAAACNWMAEGYETSLRLIETVAYGAPLQFTDRVPAPPDNYPDDEPY